MNKLLLFAALAVTAYATVDECSITWEDLEDSIFTVTDEVTLEADEFCYHTFFEAFAISADDDANALAYIYGLEGDDWLPAQMKLLMTITLPTTTNTP